MAKAGGPGCLRLGRGIVSTCALFRAGCGQVRFGLTVGKVNAPRSVDRALVKRIMRECARHRRESLADFCYAQKIDLDIGIRLRGPIKDVGRSLSVQAAKIRVREATEQCLGLLVKRLAANIKGSRTHAG